MAKVKKSEEVAAVREITQVKVILQGKVEPFVDYEKRLNEVLEGLPYNSFAFPSAASDGRMCTIINYRSKTLKPRVE